MHTQTNWEQTHDETVELLQEPARDQVLVHSQEQSGFGQKIECLQYSQIHLGIEIKSEFSAKRKLEIKLGYNLAGGRRLIACLIQIKVERKRKR